MRHPTPQPVDDLTADQIVQRWRAANGDTPLPERLVRQCQIAELQRQLDKAERRLAATPGDFQRRRAEEAVRRLENAIDGLWEAAFPPLSDFDEAPPGLPDAACQGCGAALEKRLAHETTFWCLECVARFSGTAAP